MKRSILRLIALVMVFLLALPLASCGKEDDSDDTPVPHEAYVKAFETAPSSATMTATMNATIGRLDASYTVTYSGNTAYVSYTRTQFGAIDETTSQDEIISTESGTLEMKTDGTETGGVGVLASALIIRSLSLSSVTDYEDTGSELSFTVKAEDSAKVFGRECEYDVDVTITLSDGRIDKISLSYEAQSGLVTAECEYEY